MTYQPECSACAMKRDELRRLSRLNEKRARAGKPPQFDGIAKVKRDMATCAQRGHHDPQAGPRARWGESA